MLNSNINAELLGLEDVIVTKCENKGNERHIYIEMPRKMHICPECGTETDKIHDYRMQIIKDIPFTGDSYLHLRKRRYRCPLCDKRFFEENTFLPRYYRMTQRKITAILNEFRKIKPASHIAKEHNISTTTAIRYFDLVSVHNKCLPEVLSIDEFKGNAGGEKYQSIITDVANSKVLDILPNRKESDLIKYFRSFSTRKSVKYFVIDMSNHFRAVGKACFPDAIIIADRFHIIRQIHWAIERVRKEEQKKLPDRHKKYFKKSRFLLMKKMEDLTPEEMNRLSLIFEMAPRLARAYYLKNKFYEVMKCKNSFEGRKKLSDWLFLAEYEGMKEFKDCITAYRNWFEEIMNALDFPWSNGFTEGCNNKTKVLKRTCFGVRNFERFRNRILFLA